MSNNQMQTLPGQQVIHVAQDLDTDLKALFNSVMNPKPNSWRKKHLPESFFKEPDSGLHSRQSSTDSGSHPPRLTAQHVRSHSSPASLQLGTGANAAPSPTHHAYPRQQSFDIAHEIPLPPGLEMAYTSTGQIYFLNYGRYIQGPSISTSVKHVVQGPPVPSRSSIGVESERSLLDSRVHTEDNQVVLNSSCIKSGDCTEAVLDSRAVKSEELEESIEGRNGYGLCQEEEPSVANIKQEENLWMWKLVKREVGVTVKTGVVGVAKLKEEEWNGHVQELEALDLKKERDGGTVEQTDRVLTEDGRLHCRSPAAEGSTPPVTYCLLKQQPAVPTSGHPPMSNSGLSVVFACSQCPFIHKEEAKLLQHIEKAHPEEYKMILGYV